MTATIYYDNVNQLAFLTNVFHNSSGAATDPTAVSCLVTDPSGFQTTHTYLGTAPADITKPLVGNYALSVSCAPSVANIDGMWTFEWIGTGTQVVDNVAPGTFRVFAPPSPNIYCGLEELKDRLGITDHTDDYAAEQAIQAASSWVNEYCVVVDTPILTADLRWVPVGSLCVGDELVGVDEYPVGPKFPKRNYRRSVVAAVPRRMASCIRIVLEDGREVISAAEHRWLARSNHGRGGTVYDWKHAQDVQPGDEISAPLKPWPEETSFEAGWASGIFDGEGWLHSARGYHIGAHAAVAQNPGLVLDRIMSYLKEAGISYTTRSNGNGSSFGDHCQRIDIGSRAASMELLGRIQPCRLMPRSSEVWEGGQVTGSLRVVSVEPAGVREVVSLGTSTGTYIANGLVSHNCGQHFYRITETRTFVPKSVLVCNIDPLISASSLNVDTTGNGVFDQAWVLNTDYQLFQSPDRYNLNAAGVQRPYKKVQVIQSGKWFPFLYPYAHLDRVQVVGTWGWPSVPPAVAQATLVLAVQWFKEKDAPFGVTGVSDYGVVRIQQNPWVVEMLRPYIDVKKKVGV